MSDLMYVSLMYATEEENISLVMMITSNSQIRKVNKHIYSRVNSSSKLSQNCSWCNQYTNQIIMIIQMSCLFMENSYIKWSKMKA